jgi:hypothetical protein
MSTTPFPAAPLADPVISSRVGDALSLTCANAVRGASFPALTDVMATS